jgi:hypothetical protein
VNGKVHIVLLAVLGVACSTGKAMRSPTQEWTSQAVSSVEFTSRDISRIRRITERNQLEDLLGCLARASEVTNPGDAWIWTHRMDVIRSPTEGQRWTISLATGEFEELSKKVAPPRFRLREADRVRVAEMLAKE